MILWKCQVPTLVTLASALDRMQGAGSLGFRIEGSWLCGTFTNVSLTMFPYHEPRRERISFIYQPQEPTLFSVESEKVVVASLVLFIFHDPTPTLDAFVLFRIPMLQEERLLIKRVQLYKPLISTLDQCSQLFGENLFVVQLLDHLTKFSACVFSECG